MMTEPIEILIVDDDADAVDLPLRALRAHNVADRVAVARDGVEALDYLLPNDPADAPSSGELRLVLLDLKMPRVGGLEVLARLKASERTMGIPVVVLTSSGEERDLAASYGLGANSYIVKPVDFQQFVATVGAVGMYWLRLNQVPS